MILASVQHVSVIVVLAYLLARTSFAARFSGTLSKRAQVFVILLFSCIGLYGMIGSGKLTAETAASTVGVGAALAGFLFGMVPGVSVAALNSILILFRGGATAWLDVVVVLGTGLFCGWYRGKVEKRDAVVCGILVGAIEILHMLLIVACVRPLDVAKQLVYDIGFTMIVLNGCAVILFIMLLDDVVSRKALTEKQASLKSELDVAARIQISLVDKNYDLHTACDLHALLFPANEVGGDLYSFYKKGEEAVYFILGDVSGKGVPAAITMSRTVAMFQMNVARLDDPGEIFAAMNESLCTNNTTSMFVTAVLGRLDLASGEMTCANAGHTPPFLTEAGAVSPFPRARGLALGVMEGVRYKTVTHAFKEGQYAVFYTDGVSEAEDVTYAQFGEARIAQALTGETFEEAQAVNQTLLDKTRAFVNGNKQSDDIAILSVGWRDPGRDFRIQILAEQEAVAAALRDMDEALRLKNAPGTVRAGVQEACLAWFDALEGAAGLHIALRLEAEHALLRLEDDGSANDPFAPGALGSDVLRNAPRIAYHAYASAKACNTLTLKITGGGDRH